MRVECWIEEDEESDFDTVKVRNLKKWGLMMSSWGLRNGALKLKKI